MKLSTGNWRRLAFLVGLLTVSAVSASTLSRRDHDLHLVRREHYKSLNENFVKRSDENEYHEKKTTELNNANPNAEDKKPKNNRDKEGNNDNNKGEDDDNDEQPDFESDTKDHKKKTTKCSLGTAKSSIKRITYDMSFLMDKRGSHRNDYGELHETQVIQSEVGLVSTKANKGMKGKQKVCAKLVAKKGDVCKPGLDLIPANTDKKVNFVKGQNGNVDTIPGKDAFCLTTVKSNSTDISIRPMHTESNGQKTISVMMEATSEANLWKHTVRYNDGTVQTSLLHIQTAMSYFVTKTICKKCSKGNQVHSVIWTNIHVELDEEDTSFTSSLTCNGPVSSSGFKNIGKAMVQEQTYNQSIYNDQLSKSRYHYHCNYLQIPVKADNLRSGERSNYEKNNNNTRI